MTIENNYMNRQIGNYRVIGELANSAFRRVYLAQHIVLTKRVVAIKLLDASHLGSPEEQSDFLREAQFLEELKHPYILPIFDVGIEDGSPYIVAEYAPNGSLRDRIKSRAPHLLSFQEVLTILSQIGQALHYAHQRQVIHRDLKPENILFNARNEALLADFGLATSLSTTSIKHVDAAGTPRYMAPEQFHGNVSKESDQYCLACIAYELVTGRPPFIDKDFYAIGFKHLAGNPTPPTQFNPYLPITVEQVILKAMAKQRTDRYPDISSFISALLQSTDSQPYILASSDKEIPDLFPSLAMATSSGEPQSNISIGSNRDFQNNTEPGPTERDRNQTILAPELYNEISKYRIQNSLTPLPSIVATRAGSRYRWVLLAVLCLVLSAGIIAALLLGMPSIFSPHGTSNTSGSSQQGRETALSTKTSGKPAQHATLPGRPTSQPTASSTGQVTKHATAQPTASPTARPTSQPTIATPTSTTQPTPTPTPTSESLIVAFTNPNSVQTYYSYSGLVTVTVSGAGGVAPLGWSDAFYEYVDFSGNALNPPQHTRCWVMDIDGVATDNFISTPAYNPDHSYQFSMIAPGGPLSFIICDNTRSDNHDYIVVTVTAGNASSSSSARAASTSNTQEEAISTDVLAEEDKKI